MTKGIFVSYRRDDAAHVTGRIHDFLASRFGAGKVFMDVDSVAPGEDFVSKIGDTIAACDVFLVIIGPAWLEARTADGRRRIDLPQDFVRIELAAALSRGVKIIPVLVDNAGMPRQEDLPEDVAQMVRHNAVFLNHTTFRRDMEALAASLAEPAFGMRLGLPAIAAGAAGAAALLALGIVLLRQAGPEPAALTSTVSLAAEDDGIALVRDIGFRAERNSRGKLHIRTDFPYRDRLYEDGELSGMPFMGVPFRGRTVPVEITLTNTGDRTVEVTELLFEVVSADPDLRPLPVMREQELDYRRLRLSNEGWGGMDPVGLRIDHWGVPEEVVERAERRWRGDLILWDPCAQPERPVAASLEVLQPEEDPYGSPAQVFDLEGRVPAVYDGERFVCATGELIYTSLGETRTAAFRTRISNRRPDKVVAAPAIGMYDLYLDPDRDGYVAVVPAEIEVEPGGTVKAVVSVLTDRSSEFSLIQSARLSDGKVASGEAFGLEIFMPRSGGSGYRLNPARWLSVPEAVLEGAPGRSLIDAAHYDPQEREAARVTLTGALDRSDCMELARHVADGISGHTVGRVDVLLPDGYPACAWPENGQGR